MTDILKAVTATLAEVEIPPAVVAGAVLTVAGVAAVAYLAREANESGSKRDKESMPAASEAGNDECTFERTYGFKPGAGAGVHEKSTFKRSKPA
jgi:hypothetical protein